MRLRRGLWAVLSMLLLTSSVAAQSIRGVVTERDTRRPLPGVVVLLLSGDSAVARSLSNTLGAYSVPAPGPGQYRLRTLRIGYRPVTSSVFEVGTQSLERNIEVVSVPIALDTVRVAGRNECRVRPDSAAATFAVWEQVRTALTATQLTSRAVGWEATIVTYERSLDPTRGRVLQQNANVRTMDNIRPWVARSADSLHAQGYVLTDNDDVTTFYAPDIAVLMSDEFMSDHCWRLSSRSDTARVGIDFEPTRDRRNIPDIRGTVWVDRHSAELRRLEFRYANVSKDQQAGPSGGTLDFTRASTGDWIITRWHIRMPVIELRSFHMYGRFENETRIREIRMEGGDLAVLTHGADTVWKRPPLVLAGTVVDSLSDRPVIGASVRLVGTSMGDTTNRSGGFRLEDVLPGLYTLDIATPSLARYGMSHSVSIMFADSGATLRVRVPTGEQLLNGMCRSTNRGVVIGQLKMVGDTLPVAGAKVFAEWKDIVIQGNSAVTQRRYVESSSDSTGRYVICGAPLRTAMTVSATLDSAMSSQEPVALTDTQRIAVADLTLMRGGVPTAAFAGTVRSDSAPVAGAEISLPLVPLSATTDEKGAFHLNGVPEGRQFVEVRRLGFKPVLATIDFTARKTLERDFRLERVTTLEAVTVSEKAFMTGFDERRKLGLGSFLTREDLEKWTVVPLATVMTQSRGAGVITGPGNNRFIVGRRVVPTGREIFGELPKNVTCEDEGGRPVTCACYAQVYVDRVLMNRGDPTPPFDINHISADRIEAVEWYAGRMEVPAEFMSRQADCGVLVIHTRRTFPHATRDSSSKKPDS